MTKRARRVKDERGVSMVEAALAGIVVFFLFFSIVEAALFARTYLAARDAATSGSRAGAVGASNTDADYDILQAVTKTMSGSSLRNIQSIVVFNPQGTSLSMAPGCTTGPVKNMCNHYTAADLSRPSSNFQTGFAGSNGWPPTSRSTSTTTGLAHLGVYIQLNVGGMIGPLPHTTSSSSIVEVEPHS